MADFYKGYYKEGEAIRKKLKKPLTYKFGRSTKGGQTEKLSNIPVLLNTSFNVHGEPIIDGPDQAIKHLVDGVVDYLVMEDFVYYVE